MLMKTFKKRKLEITANASYMSAPIEAKHFPKPIDFTINNVEYHLASYVDYTSPTANLVHEPILLNGATKHSVVEGAVYTFYGESVLTESENTNLATRATFQNGYYVANLIFSSLDNGRVAIIPFTKGHTYKIKIGNLNFAVISQGTSSSVYNNMALKYKQRLSSSSGVTEIDYVQQSYYYYLYIYFGVYDTDEAMLNAFSQIEIYDNGYVERSVLINKGYTNLIYFDDQVINDEDGNTITIENNVITTNFTKVTYSRVTIPCHIIKKDLFKYKTFSSDGVNNLIYYKIADGQSYLAKNDKTSFEPSLELVDEIQIIIAKIENLSFQICLFDGDCPINEFMPYDGKYYLPFNNTLYNIGTQPLKQGDKWSTNGIKYTAETNTTSVGQAYECDTNLVEGQNIWNEQWEVGTLNGSSGAIATDNNRIRSKDFIKVNPNSTYYFKEPSNDYNMQIFGYDSNKNFVGYGTNAVENTWVGNNAQTIKSNIYYIKFIMASAYGNTYNRDIAIYEGSTARAYTPHIADEVATHYLHCDKVEQVKVASEYKTIDLGSLNWGYAENKWFVAVISDKVVNTEQRIDKISCDRYNTELPRTIYRQEAIGIAEGTSGYWGATKVAVYDPTYANATDFKNAMNGVMLTYQTATPYTIATTTPNKYLPSGQVQNNLHSSEVTCVKVDNATKYAQCKAKSSPQFNFDTEAIDLLTTTLQNEYFSVNECLCIYAEPSTTTITTPSTKTMSAPQQVEIVGKQLSVKVARQL